MSAYPIEYIQNPPVKRSRLSVFFRWLLVIPHVIWSYFYGIGAFFVAIVAWFALLFTGRYPAGMYRFMSGYVRFLTRYYAYLLVIVDQFPPFDGGEHPEYPTRVQIASPAAKYSRLKVFFRFILVIPIFILQYVFEIWLLVVAIAIWFVAVIMGKTGPGLTDAMRLPMAYYVRSTAYVYLLTERYPPLSDAEPYAPVSPAA